MAWGVDVSRAAKPDIELLALPLFSSPSSPPLCQRSVCWCFFCVLFSFSLPNPTRPDSTGCDATQPCPSQAYFMRRSALVLERLASKLPFSALALCRLVRPSALEAVTAKAATAARTAPQHRALPSTAAAAAAPPGVSDISVSSFRGHQPTYGGGGYGVASPPVSKQQTTTPSPPVRPSPLPRPPSRRVSDGDGDGDDVFSPAAATSEAAAAAVAAASTGSSRPGSSPWTVAGTSILAKGEAGNGAAAAVAAGGAGGGGGGGARRAGAGAGSVLLPSPPLVEGGAGAGGWRAASAGSDYDDDVVVEEVAWL